MLAVLKFFLGQDQHNGDSDDEDGDGDKGDKGDKNLNAAPSKEDLYKWATRAGAAAWLPSCCCCLATCCWRLQCGRAVVNGRVLVSGRVVAGAGPAGQVHTAHLQTAKRRRSRGQLAWQRLQRAAGRSCCARSLPGTISAVRCRCCDRNDPQATCSDHPFLAGGGSCSCTVLAAPAHTLGGSGPLLNPSTHPSHA
jgi:hypothetical protein